MSTSPSEVRKPRRCLLSVAPMVLSGPESCWSSSEFLREAMVAKLQRMDRERVADRHPGGFLSAAFTRNLLNALKNFNRIPARPFAEARFAGECESRNCYDASLANFGCRSERERLK